MATSAPRSGQRAPTACILCECNCGIEISDRMQPGHVSLPNGLGVDYPDPRGRHEATGVAPNELTSSEDRDWLAGTPWHKHVPARIEALCAEDDRSEGPTG
jgi:formate dehydrogenase